MGPPLRAVHPAPLPADDPITPAADRSVSARVHVVAAVVCRAGRYLLARRPRHKRHGGLWEFPGGKLDAGEDHAAAARRELAEELAMRCERVGEVRWSRADPGSVYVIDFVDVDASGEPRAIEHDEVGWFTVAEMAAMELAPTDAAFVGWLGEDPAASRTSGGRTARR